MLLHIHLNFVMYSNDICPMVICVNYKFVLLTKNLNKQSINLLIGNRFKLRWNILKR